MMHGQTKIKPVLFYEVPLTYICSIREHYTNLIRFIPLPLSHLKAENVFANLIFSCYRNILLNKIHRTLDSVYNSVKFFTSLP